MADAASVTFTATILPDEIAKTLSGSITVTPADANDKWYYKLTAITTTSADLIAGAYLDYTAVDQDTAPTAIASGDKIKFLFVQNQSTTDGIMLSIDAGTAVNSLADGIFIGPSDLSASIGKIGQFEDEEVQSLISLGLENCKKSNVPAGILTAKKDFAKKYVADGFTYVAVNSDTNLIARSAENLLKEFK